MRDQSYVDSTSCTHKVVTLNAAALSTTPSSLVLSVFIPDPRIDPGQLRLSALVDSGSSDCFIDARFVKKYHIPTSDTAPVELRLLNGSFGSTITKTVTLTVTFPSGDPLVVTFYVTPLDSTCDVVLGYNWLHRYNPLVNWSENSVAFRHTATGEPSALQSFYPVDDALSIDSSMSAEDPLSAADFSFGDPPPLGDRPEPPSFAPPLRKSCKKPSYPFEPIYEYPPGDHFIISSSPKISVISAAAYLRACKEPGAHQFSMRPDPGTSLCEAQVQPADVSDIPPEYRDYADVFSDTLSEVLPDHRPYDHKIELEDGALLPKLGPVYSLSQTELKAL